MHLEVSHDGKYFFTGGYFSDKIMQRSMRNGEIVRIFKVNTFDMLSMAITSDGKYMISGSTEGIVKLWDVRSATVLKTYTMTKRWLCHVSITIDGKYFVTSWSDHGAEVREFHSGKMICQIDKSNTSDASRFHIAANSTYLVEHIIINGPIVIWDMLKGEKLYVLDEKYMNATNMVVASNANYIFFTFGKNTLSVWDIAKREEYCNRKFTYRFIDNIYCTTNGQHLLATNSEVIELWDMKEKKLLFHKAIPHSGDFTFVYKTPLTIHYGEGSATLCDIQKNEKLWSIFYKDDEIVTCVTTKQLEMEFDIEPWVQKLWDWADVNKIPKEILPRRQDELMKLEELDFRLDDPEYDFCSESIPKELGNMTNLTHLSIASYVKNKNDIPEEIGLLHNLESLSLYLYTIKDLAEKNLVLEFPESVSNLTKITELYLCGDISVSSIELFFKKNTNLYRLDIENNDTIETLPKSICPSKTLSTLNLKGNNNLLLSQEQFAWGCKMKKNENKGIYNYPEHGLNFKYYSKIPWKVLKVWQEAYDIKFPNTYTGEWEDE